MRITKYFRNSLSLKQLKANKAAQDYNAKYSPLTQGYKKGLIGLTRTDNGGVYFRHSPYIYSQNSHPVYIVIIATGSRRKDFKLANEKIGFGKTPSGYTWHHLDDYNVKDGTFTLELVECWAHRATAPHSGGCAQYKAATGHRYT